MLLSLNPTQKIVLAAVALLALAAGGLHLVTALRSGGGPDVEIAYDSSAPSSAAVRVHVVGAVNRPGVYPVALGARVSDAIEAAGGLSADAVRESVNLAGFVDDGQQVVVAAAEAPEPEVATDPEPSATTIPAAPAEGASHAHMVGASAATPPPSPDAAATPAAAPPDGPAATDAGQDQPWPGLGRASPVSINTATPEQLMALPGIRRELAMRIIYYRHTHGPYHRVEDLLKVEGISQDTLEEMRGCITI